MPVPHVPMDCGVNSVYAWWPEVWMGERGPTRPDSVFQKLLDGIVSGQFAAGQSLPSERALSEQLSVSRSVLREALKRLAQLGLITTQHGGSSRINDYRRTAGLDLLGLLANKLSPEHASHAWLPLLEMRAAIGADAARLCAQRASPALRQELVSLARQMAQTTNAATLLELEVTFWRGVLEGSDNIAYRLAFNTMLQAFRGSDGMAQRLTLLELQRSESRVPLADAIARGDGARAESEAKVSLRRSTALIARPADAANKSEPPPSESSDSQPGTPQTA